MKKIILSLMLAFFLLPQAYAGEGDEFITINTGLLFQNTLNAISNMHHYNFYERNNTTSQAKNPSVLAP